MLPPKKNENKNMKTAFITKDKKGNEDARSI